MKMSDNFIADELFSHSEPRYRDFMAKLLPTVRKESIIGVRLPALKKIAKKIKSSGREAQFIQSLPHNYYEENLLHAFLIMGLEYDRCIFEIKRFLPFVDNWGVCDSLRPSSFSENKDALLSELYGFLESSHTYTVRFGIEMLMLHFLGDSFSSDMPERIFKLKNGDYYLDMMIAWYFATALVFRYEEILPYLTEKRLSAWVHNKTISKACESLRIPQTKKEYLKSLRIKAKG